MIRYTLAALALLPASAVGQTAHTVIGADPTPIYNVCDGDILILRKAMGRDLKADGTRDKSFGVWIDRQNGRGFAVDGATKLRFVELVQDKGWVYTPVDAAPCAEPVTVHVPIPEAAPISTSPLFGANLSGAEASGGDAVRPSMDDFKGYIERYGFRLIRYPFKMDRMTPARIAELKDQVAYAGSKGVPVILDRHDYTWRTPDVQIHDWTEFARNFPDDGSVILDLVNEPRGFNDPVVTNDYMQWVRDAKLTIAGLRANGIKHPIALEWPGWSATFRFDKGERPTQPCGSAGCALDRDTGGPLDPLNRTFMNGHRYWDKGSSGTSKSCDTTLKSSGIDTFAANLRKRGLKGLVTEAAFGSSYGVKDSCAALGADAIADFKANGDVLYGVAWWGGGRIWPESYLFKIDGKKATRYTMPLNPYLVQLTGN